MEAESQWFAVMAALGSGWGEKRKATNTQTCSFECQWSSFSHKEVKLEFAGMKERPGGERQLVCRHTGSESENTIFKLKKEPEKQKRAVGH